ncbi:MAG: hypothetical protein AB1512_02720 [Thermodesulfobacteriota bacterium]
MAISRISLLSRIVPSSALAVSGLLQVIYFNLDSILLGITAGFSVWSLIDLILDKLEKGRLTQAINTALSGGFSGGFGTVFVLPLAFNPSFFIIGGIAGFFLALAIDFMTD